MGMWLLSWFWAGGILGGLRFTLNSNHRDFVLLLEFIIGMGECVKGIRSKGSGKTGEGTACSPTFCNNRHGGEESFLYHTYRAA